jgi:hypothetical protein
VLHDQGVESWEIGVVETGAGVVVSDRSRG